MERCIKIEELFGAVLRIWKDVAKIIYDETGEFAYGRIMYLSGVTIGKIHGERFKERFGKLGIQLLKDIVPLLEPAFHDPKLEKVSEEEIVLSCKETLELPIWKSITGQDKADCPACFLSTGYIEGVIRSVMGSEQYKAEEIKCTIQGAERCVFRIVKR